MLTSHTRTMKNTLKLWIQLLLVMATMLLLVGSAALPLVFTDAVVTNFVRVLELVSRLT